MKTTIAFEKELNKRFDGKSGAPITASAALRAEMRFLPLVCCVVLFFSFFS
jgi:hypothetical protein